MIVCRFVQVIGVSTDSGDFRGRDSSGKVGTYQVPSGQVPEVIQSSIDAIVQEGETLNVTSVMCGSGGFIYVTGLGE